MVMWIAIEIGNIITEEMNDFHLLFSKKPRTRDMQKLASSKLT